MSEKAETIEAARLYSKNRVYEFLLREFAKDQAMRWRLTNLIDGIRQAEFERGYRAALNAKKSDK